MATPLSLSGIRLSHLNSSGELLGKEDGTLRLQPLNQTENFLLRFFKGQYSTLGFTFQKAGN